MRATKVTRGRYPSLGNLPLPSEWAIIYADWYKANTVATNKNAEHAALHFLFDSVANMLLRGKRQRNRCSVYAGFSIF